MANLSVFYANGKLLLTGEYYVLEGARALALPTRFGQYLCVENTPDNRPQQPSFVWSSIDADGSLWWEGQFRITDTSVEAILNLPPPHRNPLPDEQQQPCPPQNNLQIAHTLQQILQEAINLNPDFAVRLRQTASVRTILTFPRHWGLGSSSTLIANIARWANCNPFQLLFNTMKGSGYDIACAQAQAPIFYQKKSNNQITWQHAKFSLPFADKLYFLYLNKKQDSRHAIAHFYQQTTTNRQAVIDQIEDINRQLLTCRHLHLFEQLIARHETLIAQSLDMVTVQSLFFADYWGQIKSLGAWGGDFLLLSSQKTKAETAAYFAQKGFTTLFAYREMVY